MKILHILTSNRYSGAENVACQIISLYKNEYTVAYCSPDGEIRDSLLNKGIDFLSLKKMCKSEVKKAIIDYNPDIIHAHDPRAICIAAMIKGNFKIIAHVHNNRPDFKRKSFYSRIFNYFTKKKNIKQIIWVSSSCLEDYVFKNNIKNKSIVLNNVINQEDVIDKSINAELQDKTDIVFLGRLTYQKNPQRLISIMHKLLKLKPNLKIAIIGDGDLLGDIKNMVDDLELTGNIKIYGFLDNAFGLLSNSKIFLLTSRFEGNPMCILEAQTLGLPVIAPEISELKTTVIDNISGYLYSSDDECINKLLELLNNEDKYNILRNSTLEFSKKYNNLIVYKNTLNQVYGKDSSI